MPKNQQAMQQFYQTALVQDKKSPWIDSKVDITDAASHDFNQPFTESQMFDSIQ